MSIIGTGVAAAVANAHVSSKQSAKNIKKDSSDGTHRANKAQDIFVSHLQGIEEGEEDNASDRLHLDSELPDSGTPSYEEPEQDEEEEEGKPSVGDQMLKDLDPRHLGSPYMQGPPESRLDIKG